MGLLEGGDVEGRDEDELPQEEDGEVGGLGGRVSVSEDEEEEEEEEVEEE